MASTKKAPNTNTNTITLPFVCSAESITPETAQHYLQTRDPKNRKISPMLTRRYAGMITRGAWGLVHQGIAFDHEGKLFDGQHRLSAIVQSNQTCTIAVFRYTVPSDAKQHVDCGKARTLQDRINLLRDEPVGATLLATARAFHVIANEERQVTTTEIDQSVAAMADETVQWASCLRVPDRAQARAAMAWLHPVAPEKIESIEADLLSPTPSRLALQLLRDLGGECKSLNMKGGANYRLGMLWCRIVLAFVDGAEAYGLDRMADEEMLRIRDRRAKACQG